MNKPKKILIIKPGYSEMLDERNNSRKVSLGDVIRATPILNLFKNDHVTWVTDPEAVPLLEGNSLIQKIIPYDFTTALQLEAEEFDTVINLEKIPGICALADNIKARKSRHGFTFNSQTGEAEALDRAYEVLTVSSDPLAKKENKKNSQELLFEMMGAKWNGEGYNLGYKPKNKEVYDVALNTQIGQKWPTKAWATKNWDKLEEMLDSGGFKVTRQDKQSKEILTNLNSYMDWINSARVFVSNDSLGIHLGIALGKYSLGLFGPTPSTEVYFYNNGEALRPESNCEYIPCFKGKCLTGEDCINNISPWSVYNKICNYLKEEKNEGRSKD